MLEGKGKKVNLYTINRNMGFMEAKINLLLQHLPFDALIKTEGSKTLYDHWKENNEKAKKGTGSNT